MAPVQNGSVILVDLVNLKQIACATRTSMLCRYRIPIEATVTLHEPKTLRQYGASPFSISAEGQPRVLLVTTRGRQSWIISKGWPIRHLTGSATAAREAYEEAGLLGMIIGDEPCGSFLYEKQSSPRVICEVSVYLLRSNASFANGRKVLRERPDG